MEEFVKLQISGFIVKRNQQTESQKRLFDLLMQYSEDLQLLPKSYIYCNTNQIIYIHKEQDEENEYDFRKDLENIQQSIQNQLIQKEIEINFVIGIGKRVKGFSQLKESFEDSQTAIEYIDMIRTVIGDKDRSVVDSSKLGLFRMLAKHENKEELWSCIPESLCKLYDYDTQKKEMHRVFTVAYTLRK